MTDGYSTSPSSRSPDSPHGNHGENAASTCSNCGTAFSGEFCPHCGQKNEPLRQPIHRFIAEAIDELFGVDGRVWRSLKLLVQPGRLTQEYLAGHRVAFLRPLRLYLTASISFFLLLTVLDPVGGIIERGAVNADTSVVVSDQLVVIDSTLTAIRLEKERQAQEVDSLQNVVAQLRADSLEAIARSVEYLEGLEEVDEEMEDLGDLNDQSSQRRLRRLEWQRDLLATWPPDSQIHRGDLDAAAERLFPDTTSNVDLPAWMPTSSSMDRLREAKTGAEQREAFITLLREAIGRLPTVMFLLLPVFALLLKLIYARRGWYYSEHLVFALHTHAFAFLVFFLMAVLLGLSGGADWARQLSWILFFTIPLYFYLAQKKVFGQGWFKTALKALLLGWLYGFLLLVFGLVLAIILAALLG